MPSVEQISLSAITPDATTQARIETDAATVASYTHDMTEGAEFPPVTLFRDADGTIRVGDGAHRVEAARLAGLETIAAEVRDGGARDALKFSIQSNARHGKQFSNADKRRVVDLMLEDEELSQLSDREIARTCGVSNRMVSNMRGGRTVNGSHSDPLTDAERARLRVLEKEFGPDALTKKGTVYDYFQIIDKLWEFRLMLGFDRFTDWLSKGANGNDRFVRQSIAMFPHLLDDLPEETPEFLTYIKLFEAMFPESRAAASEGRGAEHASYVKQFDAIYPGVIDAVENERTPEFMTYVRRFDAMFPGILDNSTLTLGYH
jgi:hypothetical protein